MAVGVGIIAQSPIEQARAEALAEELGLPMDAGAALQLLVTPDRLACRVQRGDEALVRAKPTWIDLTTIDTTSGPGRSLQNPLFKAIGIRKGDAQRPAVFDGTAGFGEDAWLLAAAGCEVTACERNPVLFALLRDALQRAAVTQPDMTRRITLHRADAKAWLEKPGIRDPKSVIYLDPMFRVTRKTAPRKPMRLAEWLLADTPNDAGALLAAALRTSARRVVVKRPRKAPPLTGADPITGHLGKALRFDVYRTQQGED